MQYRSDTRMDTNNLIWKLIGTILIIKSNCMSLSFATSRRELLENITNGYDPTIPPSFITGIPTISVVQLYVIMIDSISDSSMDYSMSMFVRQKWNDTRLAYPSQPGFKSIELDKKSMDSIWIPDLFFLNEKEATFHDVTVPNKLMHLYSSGMVVYSMRISGTFSCTLHLYKYPLDKQICSLRLESYGYSAKTLLFRWNEVAIELAPGFKLPQFDLGEIKTHNCEEDAVYAGVQFACLNITLELTRQYGYYLIQVFIPSVLTVALSWVSFWLNVDAVPARVSLGILTVLTTTTQSSGALASLPRVSYVKAIDVWMSMCLLFVFSAFIEYAYVNVLARVERRKNQSTKEDQRRQENGNDVSKLHVESNGKIHTIHKEHTASNESYGREKARVVDKISRVIFPLAFVLFNLIFWLVYIFWQPESLSVI